MGHVCYEIIVVKFLLTSIQCNQITTIAVSKNKKWIVTADAGSESMLIVWELSIRSKSPVDERISVIPIKTIFGPHSKTGVLSAKFSPDSKYLYTLGNEEEAQVLAIWDWSVPDIQGPIAQVKLRGEQQVNYILTLCTILNFFNVFHRRKLWSIRTTLRRS